MQMTSRFGSMEVHQSIRIPDNFLLDWRPSGGGSKPAEINWSFSSMQFEEIPLLTD